MQLDTTIGSGIQNQIGWIIRNRQLTEPITFSFTPDRTDYIRTLRAFTFHLRSTKITLTVVIIIFLAAVAYELRVGFHPLGLIFLFLPYYVVMSIFFINPITISEKTAADERLSSETTWTIDGEHMSIKTRFSDSNVDWGSFREVYESKAYYLFIYAENCNMFQYVPKRAFATSAQLSNFHTLLEEKFKVVRQIRTVTLPEPSPKTIRLVNYGLFALFAIVMVVLGYLEGINQ